MRLIPIAVALIQVTILAQGRVPAPDSVFGFSPGADYKLATYDQLVDYFKKVDAASDRVKLFEAGQTSQGRTFYYALVSSRRICRESIAIGKSRWRLAHPEAPERG